MTPNNNIRQALTSFVGCEQQIKKRKRNFKMTHTHTHTHTHTDTSSGLHTMSGYTLRSIYIIYIYIHIYNTFTSENSLEEGHGRN